jgi:hypothetical protein
MSESTGQYQCPGCKRHIRYPLSKAGLSGKCPGCGDRITLPALPAPATTPAKQVDLVAPEAIKTDPVAPTIIKTQIINAPPPVVQSVEVHLPAVSQESELARYMSEGQSPSMIAKLYSRVKEICTSNEEVMYMAVQQKPIANLSPDAVVLTSKRAIIFRQRMLGQMEFIDVPWSQIADVHVKENLIGATLSITGSDGHRETLDYLPKDQARKVYRYGQEMEERMIEWRRNRMLEETRAGADQLVVNTAVATPQATQPAQEDPIQRLAKLKSMLDAGLIEADEFAAAKAKILSSI